MEGCTGPQEIICKGKRVDNGKWVEGYFVAAKRSWHKYGHHEEWIIASASANGGYFSAAVRHAVVAESIGLWTGAMDCEGTRVFVGDVLALRGPSGDHVDNYGIVRQGEYCSPFSSDNEKHIGFYVEWKVDSDFLRKDLGFWLEDAGCRVVGNVADTGEEGIFG